jgi:protoporphyrin/coproporphyrin ferrochelatase
MSENTMNNLKTGVVLLNMGGPDRLDDVQPFLYNLFSDREIIRLGPSFLQKPLAWLISRRRAAKSRSNYARIGGGSPLQAITRRQADALGAALAEDGDFVVSMTMRYWPPLAEEAIKELLVNDVKLVIVLTLYPHYSKATTGSSLVEFRRQLQRMAPQLTLLAIESWPEQYEYIEALAETVAAGRQSFGPDCNPVLIYSAHSLPVSFIEKGDPYVDHLKKTISALEKVTKLPGRLCYQSRSGPVQWLEPSTLATIEQLAREGCRDLLVLPISFVSDHIETLYEIDMLFKDHATSLGMRLHTCPALNDRPTFIAALRRLVLSAAELTPRSGNWGNAAS